MNSFNDIIDYLFPEKKKTAYEADFKPVGEYLSIFNRSFVLDGRHSETIDDSLKNAIVFGSTGNFKSSGIIIPSILRMHKHASLVIHDPTHELRIKCAAKLHKSGVDVKTLNWSNPDCSEAYNPLMRIKSTSDILKISKILITNSMGEGGKDPFWNLSAESLLTFSIRLMLNYEPPEKHNLYCVYHFISTMLHTPTKTDQLIVKTKDELLISEYKSFLAYGDKTLASVIATCRTALSIFGTDPHISLITSFDSLNFLDFKKTRTAIFINTKIQDQKYYSVITSLFLQQFFAELMTDLRNKKDFPVFFLIEEASSLFFSGLPITLANCRKFGCSILQVYQSKGQLIDLYGQALARSILENSYATVYMGGQSIQVSQELESILGKFEYKDEKNARQIRSLLTANEIHELDESIIILGNKRPIKAKTIPYFKQFWLNQQTKLPPFQPKGKLSNCKLPNPGFS
jgi:type IV secretion system protein VirD4